MIAHAITTLLHSTVSVLGGTHPNLSLKRSLGRIVDGANYTNSIGSAALGGHWVDPEFDPALRAYYYVRVLEIPTPSWLAYDSAYFGSLDLPEDAVMQQQERAYTSPIWYTLG